MRIITTLALLFSVFLAKAQGPQTTISVPINSGGTSSINALLYLPDDYASTSTKYPLLVFLHGAGESGTNLALIYNNSTAGGPAYFIAQGSWPGEFTNPANGQQYKYIVLSPQRPGGWSTSAAELKWVMNHMNTNYRVDTNRIYVTGLSAGGQGTVEYGASYGVTAPSKKAAAIVPMSPAIGNPASAPYNTFSSLTVTDSVRVWGFGDDPGDVFGSYVKTYTTQMNAIVTGWARYTDYSGGHCCWNTFYNPTYKELVGGVNMSIYEWMLQYSRGSSPPPGNTPPTVNAGGDQSITLPTTSVALTATASDPDGTIASVAWSTVSGPGGNTIVTPTELTTNVTGLSTGTYVFRCTVTDNSGASTSDDVSVTVYSGFSGTINVNIFGGTAPYSNSQWNNWNTGTGAFTTGVTSGTFNFSDGSSSSVYATLSHQTGMSDNGTGYLTTTPPAEVGRFASYNWVVDNSRTLRIRGLNPSSNYDIILYSSRNNAGEATDFVINGVTKRVNSSGNLSGTAVYNNIVPDGSSEIVVSVRWVANWSYINGFTIIDNGTIPPPANTPPTVNAGVDQVINSTSTTVTGTASDADGSIAGVLWSVVSRPASTLGQKYAVTQPGGARHTLVADAGGYITKTTWTGYNPGDTIMIGSNAKAVAIENLIGSPTNYYVIRNAPGVKVILGDSTWAGGSYAEGLVIRNSKYLHIYGTSLDSFQVVGSNMSNDVGGAPARNAYTNVAFTRGSGHITFHDIRIRHGGVGLLAKTDVVNSDASTWFPYKRMDSLEIYNVNVFNTYNEGFYIGHTAPYWNIVTGQPYYPAAGVVVTDTTTYKRPNKWFTVAIHDNTLDSIGNDGIQLAAMDSIELYNNRVTNWAWKNVGGANSSHCGGLLIGGRISGFYVHDNILNRAWGEPIQVYAESLGARIHNNLMWRTFYGDGISMRAYNIVADVVGNTVFAINGIPIRINGAFGQIQAQQLKRNNLIRETGGSHIYVENGGTFTEGSVPNDNKKYTSYASAAVDSTNYFAPNNGSPSTGYGYVYNAPSGGGGSDPVIASPTSLSTLISNLVQGTYVFRLTATDDDGAQTSDDVMIEYINRVIRRLRLRIK